MRAYDPAEFVAKLNANALDAPMELAMVGLARAAEGDTSVLLFSSSTRCENWLRIPLSLISGVKHIRDVRCGDHSHPLVRIEFLQPGKEDAAASLFAQLLATALARPARKTYSGGARFAGQRSGDCEVLTFDDVPYICCQDASGHFDCLIMV